MREVAITPTFEAWQTAARTLLRERVPPSDVTWRERSADEPAPAEAEAPFFRVPRQFLDLARQVATHREPRRWQFLYAVLWRLVHGSHDLLQQGTDAEVRRLFAMAAESRRMAYRDELDEMKRVEEAGPGAAEFVPAGATLAELAEAGKSCTGCELYRHATQMVFGRGASDARIVLVGEQPGDQEDREGAPFVGPAGAVLDRALAEAQLPRDTLYVTNAVKHFKFVPRGKRRIHQTPRRAEIAACRPWLEAELTLIRPKIAVALGATAARALFGPDFRLTRERGHFIETRWAPKTIATFHPSAVLRGDDEAAQQEVYRVLVADLRLVAGSASSDVESSPRGQPGHSA